MRVGGNGVVSSESVTPQDSHIMNKEKEDDEDVNNIMNVCLK